MDKSVNNSRVTGCANEAEKTNILSAPEHQQPGFWPALHDLNLPPALEADRRSFVGGSDANTIFSGDAERLISLWRQKRGETAADDLSGSLPVMLGCWTEAFNRQWYEKISGHEVTEPGRIFLCSRHPWRRCTVDGLVGVPGAIWEAKHTNAFSNTEEVLGRYMPQLQHNMAVVGLERAVLSIIFGNHKYEIVEIAADWLYQLELLEAEAAFWDAVVNGYEPASVDPLPPPRPIGTREICLEGNNLWASAAVDWLSNRQAAAVHAAACKSIKDQVDGDIARAFGHGIEAKRSKTGAISIREIAQ